MPTDELAGAPASATVSAVADGHDLLVTYSWSHPTDGPQEGVLLVASAEAGPPAVVGVWGDSWHQQPSLMTLAGTVDGGRLELTGDYGGSWQWIIGLSGTGADRLLLTMQNVVPREHATDESLAGPYDVMVAELSRAS
jgi:hypothetical protein